VKHDSFEPRTAVREDKRQSSEAVGHSFCKTLAELITNSDSSAKRKLRLPQSSGLVDQMLQVPKGGELNTAALRAQLQGRSPSRAIRVEVVSAKGHGRTPREIVVVDEAEGMSRDDLHTALEDIAGDRQDLARGMMGRNLFGRGLSDVMRAHRDPIVRTYDGKQLSIAKGQFAPRWKIDIGYEDNPQLHHFAQTFLKPNCTGTAVRFVGSSRVFRIPEQDVILSRLANFHMLRLIAADPNVELTMTQYRTGRIIGPERISYDFPVSQVIGSFSRTLDLGTKLGLSAPLKVDFLLARSEQGLRGLTNDRDARENGLLVIDDLDAVYDLTFVDYDYEKADFLKHIFGIVRIHGLRDIIESYLNSPDSPSSPLSVDREGFKRDHEFTRELFSLLGAELKPYYERERKLSENGGQADFSEGTRKRLNNALKALSRYFEEVTGTTGTGPGSGNPPPQRPIEPVSFAPSATALVVGRPKRVHLLVRDDIVTDGCEIVLTASSGLEVKPESETIYRKKSPRWHAFEDFFCYPIDVTCHVLGQRGTVEVLVDLKDGDTAQAILQVTDVLEEPLIVPPETMEFRPSLSTGKPNRRNNLYLYLNPSVIAAGHYIRFSFVKRIGIIEFLNDAGVGVEELDVKLDPDRHGVRGQNIFRVPVSWRGTSWNQHATVEARVKVGADKIAVNGRVKLQEPDEGGFFREIDYDELDIEAPSQYAAGKITINMLDPLNGIVFGKGATKAEAKTEFDRRLGNDTEAQQRLASILLEEASFQALQDLLQKGRLRLKLEDIQTEINRYKYKSEVDVYKALVK
jgi:hypothetical protein